MEGVEVADAAYVASRMGTREVCRALDGEYVLDGESGDGMVEVSWGGAGLLAEAVGRLNETLPESKSVKLGSEGKGCKQKELVSELECRRYQELWNKASEWDRARLAAVAAPRSGVWVGVVPSRALDLQLSNDVVRSRVGRRLGVELCEEGPCPFCFQTMDRFGAHAEACMCRGDQATSYNE